MTDQSIVPATRLPAAVVRASADADKVHKAAYPTTVEDADPKDAPGTEPKADANADPKEPAAGPKDQPTDQGLTPQGNPPAAEPVRSEKVENGSWEQKYWSMKSRYDAEHGARLMAEQTVDGLRGVIATLNAPSAQPPADAQQTPQSLLTPQEIADYGPEFLSVVEKKAREIAAPLVSSLEAKVAELQGQLRGVGHKQAQSDRASLHEFMNDKMPNWLEINKDPKFIEWLGLHDPLSGAKRHDMLMQAFEANNSPRVLAFFKGYLSEEGRPEPEDKTQPAPTQNGKVPLESLAAPGRAKTQSAAPPAPSEKPIYTQAQIQGFYADVSRGLYRGKDAEKNRIEADIFAAQAEGRIR